MYERNPIPIMINSRVDTTIVMANAVFFGVHATAPIPFTRRNGWKMNTVMFALGIDPHPVPPTKI